MSVLCLGLLLGAGCSKAMEGMPARDEAAGQAEPMLKPKADQAIPARKVIYTAEVNLSVESFETAQTQLLNLVKQEKGYVAHSEVGGSPGQSRWGRWRVRIPVGQMDAFLAAVAKLGEQDRVKLDSQDVTEEYYDLDARVRNKKLEEERLLKHLKDSTGKLEDILAVERELSRVRDEIERSEGRLRLLANLTDLTTITVMLRERGSYSPGGAPSYGTTLGRTFNNSLQMLVDFGKMLLMLLVGSIPWLVVLAVIGWPLWKLRHRFRPVSRSELPAPPPAGEA
jgi:hypothetical protein